ALAGFSQGAMMSLERALRGETRPAALVLLSGAAPSHIVGDWERLRGVPVFVSHGRQDSLLPFSGAEEIVRHAEAAGASVTFVPFDGGHSIPPAVITRLEDFLRGVLVD
nr:phospholipase [Myxococcota bacterium]